MKKKIKTVNQDVADSNGQISTGHTWANLRIMAPLHIVSRQMKRARRLVELITPAIRLGGGLTNTLEKVIQIFRREGLVGIRRGIRLVAASQYVNNGHSEPKGSQTNQLFDLSMYLPHTGTQYMPPKDVTVDVIIPVYRGFRETKRCLESVLSDADRPPGIIRVIDDCSPEQDLSEWLSMLSAAGLIELSRNTENVGFVATVNRGIVEANRHDVVLLNSDTEVPSGWLRRLTSHAYTGQKIASVTPFSNNATICSYPTAIGGPLPNGYSLGDVDNACRVANGLRTVKIPTAVGFCMYIRRDCLDDIGLFDADRFGRGYGEENDFCMRASANGWHHLLACDTFVYHAGEVSFGKDSPDRRRAWDILVGLHPRYPALVAEYVSSAQTTPPIFAVTAALFKASALPTILMISHNLGGGTERHIKDLVNQITGIANVLLLRPNGLGLELLVPSIPAHPTLNISGIALDDLVTFLRAFGVSRVHIHHWIGLNTDLRKLVDSLSVPFDLTVHDYFSICPHINFLPAPDAAYCGEPEIAECNVCIRQRGANGATDISSWRVRHNWLLTEAARVICPSHDVVDRLIRFGHGSNVVFAPHEPVLSAVWPVTIPSLAVGEPLRVAVVGVLAWHKGRRAFEACVESCDAATIKFILIGEPDTPLPAAITRKVHVTGRYVEADLPGLIADVAPHVIWFPNSWPETYSYTLTAAIKSGLPIVASGLGALKERLVGRPHTRVMDNPSCSASDWLALFSKVAESLRSSADLEAASPRSLDTPFYPNAYLDTNVKSTRSRFNGLVDLREPGRLSVLMLPDRFQDGRISPCGYIRLLQPMDYMVSTRESVRLHEVDVNSALHRVADCLVCQRHVVTDIKLVEQLINHCRETGMRLIYDLDDDLITDAPEHPENLLIRALTPVVVRLLLAADTVWASTPELRRRLEVIRPDSIVVPNALDERLWVQTRDAPSRASDRTVRILYMGTSTHDIDYEFLEGVAARIKKKFGARASFEIIGVTHRKDLHSAFRRIEPPMSAAASYPAFVSWIAQQSRWDIGVAPLVDTYFSRAKSNIKLLDYAALGLPIVASDVLPYRGTLQGIDGVRLVENDALAWVEALSELIVDTQARKAGGRTCRAAFLEKYSLAAVQERLSTALLFGSEVLETAPMRHLDFRAKVAGACPPVSQ